MCRSRVPRRAHDAGHVHGMLEAQATGGSLSSSKLGFTARTEWPADVPSTATFRRPFASTTVDGIMCYDDQVMRQTLEQARNSPPPYEWSR